MLETDEVHGLRQAAEGTRSHAASVVVAAETLLVGLLVLWQLGDRSLDVDEGFSVAMTRVPWSTFWDTVTSREANQSLYYLLLRGVVQLGATEWWLRIIPALAAAASVPVVFALGRRLFSERVGLLAGLLLGGNGFFVFYGRYSRAYSLLVLLSALSTLLFVRALERPTRRRWLVWAAISGVAAYFHLFAVLIVVAQLLSLTVRGTAGLNRRSIGPAFALLTTLLAPLAVFVIVVPGDQVDFIKSPSIRLFIHVLTALAGNGGPGLLALFALLGVLLVVAGAGAGADRRREVEGDPQAAAALWPYVLVIALLFVPIVLAFAMSVRRPIVRDQYLLVSLPAIVLMGAVGLDWLLAKRRAVPLIVVAIAVAGLCGRSVVKAYGDEGHERWRDATAFVLAESRADDGLLFAVSDERGPFEYYAARKGYPSNAPVSLYPTDRFGHLAPRSEPPPARDDAAIDALLAGRARIWVVQRGLGPSSEPRFQLPADRYTRVDLRHFANVDVTLYVAISG